MLWVLHFKTTLNSWLRCCRKARCGVVVGICYSRRCWLPNYLRVLAQVVTEAEVPTRCHSHPRWRASSWLRSLYLADQTVPTPKYTNKLLFVYSFIFSLLCVVFPQAKTLSLGEVVTLPWAPLVSSCRRRAPCSGQCPVGLCLTPPSPASHPEHSPASHLTILDVVCLAFSIPLKHDSSSWCHKHPHYLKVLPGNPHLLLCFPLLFLLSKVLFGLTCTIKVDADRPVEF